MHSNTSSRSKLSLRRKKPKDDSSPSLSSKAVATSLDNLNVDAQNTPAQSQSNSKLQPHNSSRLNLVITKINLSQHNASRRPNVSSNFTGCLSEGVRSEVCCSNEVGSDTELKHNRQLESEDGSKLVERNLTGMIPAKADTNKLDCDVKVEDDSDFKEPVPQMIKRKRKKQDNYMQSIEEEQLQLAMVLSASIDPHGPPSVGDTLPAPAEHAPKRPKKRAKPSKKEKTVPPLLTVSSQQAREMLAQRAQELLKGSAMDDDHIQSTPAFHSSKLLLPPEHVNDEQAFSKTVSGSKDDAKLREGDDVIQVESIVPMSPPDTALRDENRSFATDFQHFDYSTLWELTDFKKCENKDFYVPSLSSIITPVKALPHTVTTHPLTDCGSTPPTNTPPLEGHNEEQFAAVRHLCSDLRSLLGSSLFSDVEISTRGGTVISSHAVLLAARCPSLRVLLSGAKSRPIRLDWSDYEDSVVLSFLEYLYTGAPPPSQCDHAEMESLTALAREWSMRELEVWCAGSMSSVIYSQFGTTSEASDSLVTKETNTHSPETEVVSKNEERVSNSPEIIDLSQSSNKSSENTNTNCTELADEPLLISVSPKSVENISSTTTTDFDLLLGQILRSEVTSEITVSYSKTDIVKQSPSPCILLSSSDSTDPQKTEFDAAIDPTIDQEEGCNSDDLFSPSPSTTCNEVTLLPPPEPENDYIIAGQCFEGDQSIDATTITEPIQQLEPLEPELYVFDNDLLIDGSGDITELLLEDFPTPTALIENKATSRLGTPGDQLKTLTLGREKFGGTFRTPLGVGRFHLETDDDITPMPNYRSMVTPLLKVRCSKFGVKPLAKRKMIAKLEEIYDYAHPLVGEDGEIVEDTQEPPTKSSTKETKGKKAKKTVSKENQEDGVDLKSMVKASICSNEQLYQDILMYKPLELALIHSMVKDSGVSVSKEKLRDILDQWCVTFTIPRHADMQKTDTVTQKTT